MGKKEVIVMPACA